MSQCRKLSSHLEDVGYLNQSSRLVSGTYIQSSHISSARLALAEDRDSLYKNALIAYSGAFRLILSNNYSWAFVHSYYSIFYFYQVLLAFNDVGLCYDHGKPYSIKLTGGAQFKKEDSNTHKSVFNLFKNYFDNDSDICSEIEGEKVYVWFENMRNRINYRTVPQLDPAIDYGLCPYTQSDELRKKISLYLNDINTYAYTPENAYVAYPLLLIKKIVNLYKAHNIKYSFFNDTIFFKHLSDNIRDVKGPITSTLNLIKT